MSIACVEIPHLPLQCAVARAPELRSKLVIIYHGEEARPVVLDASPDAHLRRGTSLIRAMSQHPEAAVIRADEAVYDARWHDVVEKLLNISDRVEDAARGCAFVAIDGLSELYGSQDQTVALLSETTTKHGFESLIGVAPGRFPAYCAAIRAQPYKPIRLSSNRTSVKEFLAPMPVDILPLDTRAIELMHDFALDTMGDLAAQSVSALQAQLGPEARRAWELVNGIDPTRLNTIERMQTIVDTLQFPWPVASMDALSFGIRTLLDRAFASVQRVGKAVGRMDLTCEMSDSEHWNYTHVFKEPTDSTMLAHSVVMTYVETVVQSDASPIRSPIEVISVELARLGPARAEQSGLWNEHEKGDLDTALRQLSAQMNTKMNTKMSTNTTSSPIKTVVDVEPWSRIPERRQALAEVTSR